MPAIEAAVAKRIARDIVPQLQNVYAGTAWGLTAGSRLYPFAAPFADPGPGAGTSNFAGVDGTYQGLLPFNQVDCTADAANPRCLPGAALTSWATYAAPRLRRGRLGLHPDPVVLVGDRQRRARLRGRVPRERHLPVQSRDAHRDAGHAQERRDGPAPLRHDADAGRRARRRRNDPGIPQTVNHAKTINADGSLTITFWADLPNIDSMGLGTYAEYRIRIERLVVRDHALLDPNDATTGWFVRNEWFRLLYYAVAADEHRRRRVAGRRAAPATATACGCMTWPGTTPAWDKRALLILAGRALRNQTRPSTSPVNYVELQNNDGGTMYEQRPVSRTSQFTDRVIVVDAN